MQQLLVTPISERKVGWPALDLDEIVPMPRLFPLPRPVPHVMAAAVVRGRLITVLDAASLTGGAPGNGAGGFLLRMAPPFAHLAFAVPAVESVVPFQELDVREEKSEGIWAGAYPWEGEWISVIRPAEAAAQVESAVVAVRNSATGRNHAS